MIRTSQRHASFTKPETLLKLVWVFFTHLIELQVLDHLVSHRVFLHNWGVLGTGPDGDLLLFVLFPRRESFHQSLVVSFDAGEQAARVSF